MESETKMTIEQARAKARELLSRGFVAGASVIGDVMCEPSDERIDEVARGLMSGELRGEE